MTKRIAILGVTGSIGSSTLRVLRALPGEFSVALISAGGARIEQLAKIAAEFKVPYAVTSDETRLPLLRSQVPSGTAAYAGESALCDLLQKLELDLVLVAIVGSAALKPVLASIKPGRSLALANKEALVMSGAIVKRRAAEAGVKILPVDSEHSAVFQCLERGDRSQAARVILTASGGPFRKLTKAELAKVTLADALKHPTWNMGPKVTLDSASLMNKALEMIEAHHLFDMPQEKIDVLVHPQSIVHSMVEWCDGSVHALLSVPDMIFPIQYALTWQDRKASGFPRLDLAKIGSLTFEEPDEDRFPSLKIARRAMTADGTMPAVMNAANAAAAARFCKGEIAFPKIWQVIQQTMDAHRCVQDPSLENILEADAWARNFAAHLKING